MVNLPTPPKLKCEKGASVLSIGCACKEEKLKGVVADITRYRWINTESVPRMMHRSVIKPKRRVRFQ
jgi:hypothetical protein